MSSVVIFGAGGHGRETFETIEAIRQAGQPIEIVGFLDDDQSKHGTVVHGLPVLGGRGWLERRGGRPSVALGIGSPAGRAALAAWLVERACHIPRLVHPTAMLSKRARLGDGVMIMAGSLISIDVDVADFVHVNVGCTVSHDVCLGRFASLAPGVHLAGNVIVEEGAEIGVGAVAISGTRVGAWSIVGGGAVVTRAVSANAVSAGVPARLIRERPPGWWQTQV
jgi:sugar O-acyltransferase (sialic acid O-acetyltransferase NeuD family)